MMIHNVALLAILAGGAVAIPARLAPPDPPCPAGHPHDITPAENAEIWRQRFRCDRFYSIASRTQCVANANRYSDLELSKRKK